MRLYLRLADHLLSAARFVSIGLMAAMTLSILIGVFFRYVIAAPLAWPPEAARFMMVAITMIAGSIAVRQLEHVGISLVVTALPRRLGVAVYLAGLGLVGAFLAVFVVYSLQLTLGAGFMQRSSSLGVPMAAAYVSMPVGGSLMLLQLIAVGAEGLRRHRSGGSPFEPPAGETGRLAEPAGPAGKRV